MRPAAAVIPLRLLGQVALVGALGLSACGETSSAPVVQDFGAFKLKVPRDDEICGSAQVVPDTLVFYLPPDSGRCDAPAILVQVIADREGPAAVGVPFRAQVSLAQALLRSIPNERYVLTDPGLGGFQPMNFEGAIAWSACGSSCVAVFRHQSAVVRVTWSREATARAPGEIASVVRGHLVRWTSGP